MLNIAIWRGELRPPSIPQRPALGRSSQAGLAALSLLPARPDGRSPHRRRLRVSPAELDDLAGQGRGRRPCRCLLRCGRPWRARGRGPPRRPRLSASAPAKSRASAATSTRPPAGPTPTARQPRPSPPSRQSPSTGARGAGPRRTPRPRCTFLEDLRGRRTGSGRVRSLRPPRLCRGTWRSDSGEASRSSKHHHPAPRQSRSASAEARRVGPRLAGRSA